MFRFQSDIITDYLRLWALDRLVRERSLCQAGCQSSNTGNCEDRKCRGNWWEYGIRLAQDNGDISTTIPDPPKLVDGINPDFPSWRNLMEQKFTDNADHFDNATIRLGYLVGCTSGEAQDQLVARMQSKALEQITDVGEALDYLGFLCLDPELDGIDPGNIRLPHPERHEFWKHFRDFVFRAVQAELPPTE
ncbi:uncharacterized protein BJX67DRAFT_376235 [Aspergillus lucknowensis]|uniref:Uncharacterized protein n=1 Tax=Aspergillus lucknowensis TaxID=176173 RepID=A0ABR4M739_9EURO